MAVATSGRAVGLSLAGVLLAGALASCTASHGDPAPIRTSSSPAPRASAANFCRVPLPDSWQHRLVAGKLSQRDGEELTVHAVGTDGRTAVADSRIGDVRTVLFIRNGTRRPVMTLANPDRDQLFGAAFDGRYLVFSVSHDPSNLSKWTLYAWDSATGGRPRVLARNATGPDGHPVTSPMLYPVVAAGHAAWTAGTTGGRTELHRYTLATGTDRVVRTGHPGVPFLFGDHGTPVLLVWPESAAPNSLTRLHAVVLATGRSATLPDTVSAVHGPAFIAGSANTDTLAWVDSGVRTLWVWRSGWSAPVRVLSVPEGRNLQWVRLADNVVTVDDGTAQFAADLRTGSYTRLTPSYGYTVADGNGLAVGYPPARKGTAARAPSIVNAAHLPALPGCGT